MEEQKKTQQEPADPVVRRHTPANRLRAVVDMTMFISFILAMITGIVKLPFLYEPLMKLFEIISFRNLSYAHDIAGMVLGVGIVVHLTLSWRRFKWLYRRK